MLQSSNPVSALEFVVDTLPAAPSTTTEYVVLALRVLPGGAVKVRTPAVSAAGLRSVVPATLTSTPAAGAELKCTSTSVTV